MNSFLRRHRQMKISFQYYEIAYMNHNYYVTLGTERFFEKCFKRRIVYTQIVLNHVILELKWH